MRRLFACVVLLSACAPAPDGLRRTPAGDGPVVVVDWEAEPLPELPFPNDLATRPDPTSVTGLRLNISEEAASTEVEARARRKINEQVGFGIYMPITVSFDAPLDLDEIASRHTIDGDVSDDAFFVIDVTPGSPTYLQPAELDVGFGRFPLDVADPGKYFPNDPLADTPSLVFDTRDEDLDGDGELDPGEDLDDDGWLDVPNTYGGDDPRADLLTWYERLTNTLIFRPVVPLREETTYAVVLTERLVGEDGNPVRSCWEYVNHTRQTDALQPLNEALPPLGLGIEDVAYAWTFTTNRVTGDLVDIRRGLDAEGPWPWLVEDYPPGVRAGHELNEQSTAETPYRLPVTVLVNLIAGIGLVDDASMEVLREGYEHASDMIGGEFVSPNLLADRDDGGGDQVDEWWQLDPVAGTLSAEPETVAFTCVLPEESEDNPPPYDVVLWGHGYGSTRLEGMIFAWAMARQGLATCVIDWPGHGPDMSPSEREEIADLLDAAGLLPALEHLEKARYVDTDNDGRKDSGSHQWTADAFHTRDMVRQAAVDWMWLVASLKQCGQGTMTLGDHEALSCDWDEDGVPDIGGPDAHFMAAGGSLGGINSAVAAAVLPDFDAVVPIVAGGGLMDISLRAPTGGAVEAMHGKLMSPMFLGRPQEDGSLRITQYVDSFTDMRELPVASLPAIPVGGRVVVRNLANGEVREGHVPDDGRFRVPIPADAADHYERRIAAGIPDTGVVEGEVYSVEDNAQIGDPLRVSVFDAAGELVARFETFEEDGYFQGVTYPAGSRLVAAASGLGRRRATPDTRKLVFMVSMAVEPGDPIAYAPHLVLEPFAQLGGEPHNVLLVPTVGDMVVSVNSEIALARAAGFIERHEVDERYGLTQDEWLIERRVVDGLEEFGPYTCDDGRPCLFDPDDFDLGTDEYGAPSEAPLRATLETSSGISGMRIPYADPHGSHGFGTPEPDRQFDVNAYAINQIARYLETLGQELPDDPCLEAGDCPWMPDGGAR